jgi:hypothetical protein
MYIVSNKPNFQISSSALKACRNRSRTTRSLSLSVTSWLGATLQGKSKRKFLLPLLKREKKMLHLLRKKNQKERLLKIRTRKRERERKKR